MRALVQRVREANVRVGERITGAIGAGLLVFIGVRTADTQEDREWIVRKVLQLRIFDDAAGAMNRAITDVAGDILAVSQFTLYASTRKGNRPSWSGAAPPHLARPHFDACVAALAVGLGRQVATGEFGATMQVALINDGPVTIALDSATRE